jgi:tRNA A37 threonylcarbamoyladenosine biosynthesis protein TsaE
VVSPSFVIVRRYQGFLDLVHADIYRLGSSGEIEDLDLDLDGAVLVVEWGIAAEQAFGEDHLVVRLQPGDDACRTVGFEPHGSWLERSIDEVAP